MYFIKVYHEVWRHPDFGSLSCPLSIQQWRVPGAPSAHGAPPPNLVPFGVLREIWGRPGEGVRGFPQRHAKAESPSSGRLCRHGDASPSLRLRYAPRNQDFGSLSGRFSSRKDSRADFRSLFAPAAKLSRKDRKNFIIFLEKLHYVSGKTSLCFWKNFLMFFQKPRNLFVDNRACPA